MSGVQKPATISDLVKATGKSRPTVYRLLADGELPGYRTSRGYVIPRPWFEDWLHGRWTPAPKTNPEPLDFIKRRKVG